MALANLAQRTSKIYQLMSAFGGKANIAPASQMSANDPKRTSEGSHRMSAFVPYNYFFPGGLYKLATLDALSATDLTRQ